MHNNYDNMLLVGQKAQWNRKWCRQTTSTWSVTQEKGNTATQYGVRKGWASPTCCWIHGAPKRKHGLSIPPSHQITVSSDSRHHRQNSNTPRRKRRRKSYWFGDEQIFLKQDTKMKKKINGPMLKWNLSCHQKILLGKWKGESCQGKIFKISLSTQALNLNHTFF